MKTKAKFGIFFVVSSILLLAIYFNSEKVIYFSDSLNSYFHTKVVSHKINEEHLRDDNLLTTNSENIPIPSSHEVKVAEDKKLLSVKDDQVILKYKTAVKLIKIIDQIKFKLVSNSDIAMTIDELILGINEININYDSKILLESSLLYNNNLDISEVIFPNKDSMFRYLENMIHVSYHNQTKYQIRENSKEQIVSALDVLANLIESYDITSNTEVN